MIDLKEKFEKVLDDYSDETEFYSDLLEMGITVDVVARQVGKEQAEHMKKYCEEHGLL